MTNFDITLDGQGYMLVSGSYRASTVAERAVVRERVGRERVTGLRAWPDGSSGIRPGPGVQVVSGTVSGSEPKLTTSDGNYLFVVAGTSLHRWDRSIASAPVSRKALPADARCLVRLNDELFIGYGASADIDRYDDATNTLTASALGAGVKASLLATFARGIALVSPGSPATLRYYYGNSLSYSRVWTLDGRVLNACQLGERMVVATDAGLHLLSGSWHQDTDPPAPPETLRLSSWGTLAGQLQDADDFAWMTVFDGRLVAWLGKRVVAFDESRGWWTPLGLEGTGTDGAAVVNGWLLVTIEPRWSSAERQLWGYNGDGWWLLEEVVAGGTNTLKYPAADGAGKLVTATHGANTLRAWDLDSTVASTYASPFIVTTPSLDGGEPDREKRWLRVGFELEREDGQTVGNWSFALEYSTDGGANWMSAGPAMAVTSQRASIEHALSPAPASRSLLLRVTGTRSSGQPPFIRALWCESIGTETRRRWQFAIHARTRGIDRDGTLDPRDGQSIRAALWSLWNAAAPLPFHDIDYGATGSEHTVHLTALRESWPRPADQPSLGADTVVEVEVVG
jgi:hypothetical protein